MSNIASCTMFLSAVIIIINCIRRGPRTYLMRVLIGIDQFCNAALFGGAPDETISSRCGRGQRYWYWRWLGWVLERIDPGHLRDAVASEQMGAHR